MQDAVMRADSCLMRVLVVLLSSLVVVAGGCKKEVAAPDESSPVVSVVEVNPQDVPVSVEYVALTQSSQLVNIQARVSGFLDKRMYEEGALAKEGQVLFKMDEKPFEAQLEQAKAVLAQQNAVCETARLNYTRMKNLADEEVVSLRARDDATGNYEAAKAAVAQAEAAVESAKLNLSYATILSPVTGISSSAKVADGTYISAENSLLTTVAVLSPMWVNFSLSENEMQRYQDQVAEGSLLPPKGGMYEVEVILSDGSVFPYTGRITFAEPAYDVKTGTFLIRTSVENPEGSLHPNQSVHVRLKGAVRPGAILVPQRCVQEGSKGQFVWVVGPDKTVEQRPVVVGNWHEDQWFILEGLNAGEQVVVDGALGLQAGMRVEVKGEGASEEAGAKPEADPAAGGSN